MIKFLKLLIILMVFPLVTAGADHATVVSAQGSYCASSVEIDVLQRINAHRQQNGLEPLALSQPLGIAATVKSHDMADRDYFSHYSPDGRGPTELLQDVGYPTSTTWYGENIAAGFPDAASVFEGWMNSPGHNANMLEANFRYIGISGEYIPGSTHGWYWTTMFGSEVVTPAAACGDEPSPIDEPPGDFVTQLIAVLKRILSPLFSR